MKRPQPEGEQQPAGHRFRDVVFAEHADALVEGLPHEQHEDPRRRGKKRPDEHDAVRLQLDHAVARVIRVAAQGHGPCQCVGARGEKHGPDSRSGCWTTSGISWPEWNSTYDKTAP